MNQVTLDYIHDHAEEDVRQLALRGSKNPEVDLAFALDQIAGRQKAKTKLPSWAAIDGIIYPSHLSMEQCSSEQTAKYKASIAGKGALVVDLTAGIGVDIAFISKNFQRAVHIERQSQLCAISSENYKRLGLQHIEVVCRDGIDYLHQLNHADLIYLDPARRDKHGSRTYGIADCTPNVMEIRDELLGKADRVLIKLSPMLDWRKAVEDLGNVNEVHIVSVDNECKELLLILTKEQNPLKMVCVNNDNVFEYDINEEVAHVNYTCDCLHYLYEPNASIMKAGCFALIEKRFGICQLNQNSHLFVSDQDISDFPGRHFIIETITSMNKHDLKNAFAGIDMANVTVRNFPLSVSELRKRLKLKDGGDIFVFATTIANNRHQLFICRKKS